MLSISKIVSTGIKSVDNVLDMLRLGDNVVWQVGSIDEYIHMCEAFVKQAKQDERHIVYIRFGKHKPVIEDIEGIVLYELDAEKGFEDFTAKIHNIITVEGCRTFYVFDCLTELLEFWNSDLMIGNFFKVTCPYLFELETIAYFALMRNVLNYDTIARIRETTQLLIDIYLIESNYYIHPLKVWNRYSPLMFLPHLIKEDEAVCISGSAESSELFSNLSIWNRDRMDYWENKVSKAAKYLNSENETEKEEQKIILIKLLLCKEESKMYNLCCKYFTLADLVKIASKVVGTGYIGCKSVGMLIARKIVMHEEASSFAGHWEHHDSYYLGSDIFYTYIVQNDWWKLRMKQKTENGYFEYSSELKEKLLHGIFPDNIQSQFMNVLEHFGQSPIIVRSSSLLEDNFGNAFAGKYDSVFCVNQGTPQERYDAFEQAVKKVYASTMNEDALAYRMNRGLWDKDEQMAILVQRVSGDYHGQYYFPHLAGVANSSNLYVYDNEIDMNAGMLRLVFGLGTRAVDRVIGDHVKIVTLDKPLREALMYADEKKKFSQHNMDVLSISENEIMSKNFIDIIKNGIKTDKDLFMSIDSSSYDRLKLLGYKDMSAAYILDFKKLLKETKFAELMKLILSTTSKAYDYPVDMEFTVNFSQEGNFKINILQCRPLQTRGLGKSISMPKIDDSKDYLFYSKGNFMGGNVRLPIDFIVFIDPEAYLSRTEQEKYSVASIVGQLNSKLKNKNTFLIGPGRWGTTTASLGVPVKFTELSNMIAICEVSYKDKGLMPELSYGSHFFQDLVETGIFYIAIFEGGSDTSLNLDFVYKKENIIKELLPSISGYEDVIKVIEVKGTVLYSDISSQKIVCIKE